MSTQLLNFANAVATVGSETSSLTVAQLMRQHQVGTLVVIDNDDAGKVVGVVSDYDIIRKLIAEELDPAVFTASDIMSRKVIMVSQEMHAVEVLHLMNENQVKHVLTSDNEGRLAGIVIMEDLLEVVAEDLVAFAQGMSGVNEREKGHLH